MGSMDPDAPTPSGATAADAGAMSRALVPVDDSDDDASETSEQSA